MHQQFHDFRTVRLVGCPRGLNVQSTDDVLGIAGDQDDGEFWRRSALPISRNEGLRP
jgi:hypothetical protein